MKIDEDCWNLIVLASYDAVRRDFTHRKLAFVMAEAHRELERLFSRYEMPEKTAMVVFAEGLRLLLFNDVIDRVGRDT